MDSAAFDMLVEAAKDTPASSPRRRRRYEVNQRDGRFRIKIVTEDNRHGKWTRFTKPDFLGGYDTMYTATCDI